MVRIFLLLLGLGVAKEGQKSIGLFSQRDAGQTNFWGRARLAELPRRGQQPPLWQPDRQLEVQVAQLDDIDPCRRGLPSSLSFKEDLRGGLKPEEIVIFTGGDSLQRRLSGFPKVSADSMKAFAAQHGYGLIFLDELDYDKSLTYGGVKFHPMWHRIFALDALRARFPQAKYFVQMDDDILVPYPETDMLNHYVNLMEADQGWEMTYAEEGGDFVLNAGMFFFKNHDFAFDAYKQAMEIGLENEAYLSNKPNHEQTAIIEVRKRGSLQDRIRVIKHREGPYNFNTFARNPMGHDLPGTRHQAGDAFVHCLGPQTPQSRLSRMEVIIRQVQTWRRSLPKSCTYPLDLI